MTARIATHPEVAARGADVSDRLVAAGLEVEVVFSIPDPVQGVLAGRADLGLVGAQALRGPAAEGLTTLAVLPREDPRDALLAPGCRQLSLRTLPAGCRVGAQGPRRRAYLRAHRPDVEVVEAGGAESLRGLLDGGAVDAVVLRVLEARRSGLASIVSEILDPKSWLPAPGQGAVALVSRHPIAEATALDHLPTRTELRAEIALLDVLDAPNEAALGSLAQASGRWIRLWGALASDDGRALVRSDLTGPLDEPGLLGSAVARQLVERGASMVVAGSAV